MTHHKPYSRLFVKLALLLTCLLTYHIVYAGWAPALTLDSDNTVGGFASMAVVNGHPAMAYRDATDQQLKYIRATTVDGSVWGAPQIVESSSGTAFDPSLAIVNGYPAIAYINVQTGELRFVRANDINGATWGTPQTVDGSGNDYNEHEDPSLVIVNGRPAIAYHDQLSLDLKYVRANDANGSTWGTPQGVHTVGYTGVHPALAIVDGYPAIAYSDFGNGNLLFIRAADADGSSWNSPQQLDVTNTLGGVGWDASMMIVNGHPAISYYDSNNYDLKFIRATSTDGTTWGTPLTVDSPGTVGLFTSLAVVDGYPAISYNDFDENELRYIRALDANGATWATSQTLDAEGGRYTSLALIDGHPAIGYYDETNQDLKFIRATDPTAVTFNHTNTTISHQLPYLLGLALLTLTSLFWLWQGRKPLPH